MNDKNNGILIGLVLSMLLLFGLGATVYKSIVGTGSTTDGSIALWDGVNGNKIKASTISINSTGDMSGLNILSVETFSITGTPLSKQNGGTEGTNNATIQASLGLVPGLDIQPFSSYLLQMVTIVPSAGNFIYYDGVNYTNFASTTYGRNLLAGASYAAQLALLSGVDKTGDTMSGALKVPYIAYTSAMTNNSSTNIVPTWRAIAEKIESLIIGAFISSVDTNFTVTGGGELQLNTSAVVGIGRIVKESTLGGTNGALSALTDVTITSPTRGQNLTYDGSKWVNGSGGTTYDNANLTEEIFSPFLGSSAATAAAPFTSAAINSGAGNQSGFYNGRVGVWNVQTAGSAALWNGAVVHSGIASITLSNVYEFQAEFSIPATNGTVHRIGFSDSITTNVPTDALYLSITNGIAVADARGGNESIISGTTFTINTNLWYKLIIRGTNQSAAFTVKTNGVDAWTESLTVTNIPTGTGMTLGANASAFITGPAHTNLTVIFYLNQMGVRIPNGY